MPNPNKSKNHFVFLPGLFARGWFWDKVAEHCSARSDKATVVFPAIPEVFGGNIETAIEAVFEQIHAAANINPVILVSNSMSGIVAIQFADRYPNLVSRLVLSGSPGLDELDAGVSLSELRTGHRDSAVKLMQRIFDDPEYGVPEEGIKNVTELFANPKTMKNIVRWLSISRKFDLPPLLGRINIKIDLIWGDNDRLTPGAKWEKLAEKYEHVSYHEIERCGHSPMVEKPSEFIYVLFNAIDGRDGSVAKF